MITEEELNVESTVKGDLAVSEIFGPTFQGEGPSLGRRCFFLRLSGCNQHCSWCDTPYTWAFTDRLAALHRDGRKYDKTVEVHRYDDEEIVHQILVACDGQTLGPDPMLVISGGEPLLQQARIVRFLSSHFFYTWRIEVETAGTISPLPELSARVDQFNVSPKLENSGNPLTQRYKERALKTLQATGKAAWKFVVVDMEDLKEIDHIVKANNLSPVYIMPEGISEGAINTHAQAVAQEVLKRGWRMTTRLQILLYGPRRGV